MEPPISDDPQLTAYALGELEGEEWAAVEQRLASDPAAQKYVADVQAAASLMSKGLSEEESPGLGEENVQAVDRHIERLNFSRFGPGRSGVRLGFGPTAIAIGLLVMIVLLANYLPRSKPTPAPATQPAPVNVPIRGLIYDDPTTRPAP